MDISRSTRAARPLPREAAPCTCPRHGSETVRWLQGSLNRQRGLRLPVDGQMTPATRAALRDFQREQGLPADGTVGPPTQRALVEAGRATRAEPAVQGEWDLELSRSSAPYVMWVQSTLNRIAGAGLVVDGISGSLTKAAVKAFQARSGLAADGIVGPNTEAALLRAGASPPPGSASMPTPVPAPAPAAGPRARLSVPETDLIAALRPFLNFGYDRDYPRYPAPLPGVSVNLAPPAVTNCSCFCEGLIVGAYAQRHGSAFQWNLQRHNQMMILLGPTDLFSPVTAVVDAGIATRVPDGAPPPRWSFAQSWRSSSSGHALIIVAHHAPTDRILTLEANQSSSYKLSGVGCRNFGNLRDLPGQRPPARWWENPAAPTWSGLRNASAIGIRLAQLAVTNPTWAGI